MISSFLISLTAIPIVDGYSGHILENKPRSPRSRTPRWTWSPRSLSRMSFGNHPPLREAFVRRRRRKLSHHFRHGFLRRPAGPPLVAFAANLQRNVEEHRSEEHTSELQSR